MKDGAIGGAPNCYEKREASASGRHLCHPPHTKRNLAEFAGETAFIKGCILSMPTGQAMFFKQ
jgi:hypothetical protein